MNLLFCDIVLQICNDEFWNHIFSLSQFWNMYSTPTRLVLVDIFQMSLEAQGVGLTAVVSS